MAAETASGPQQEGGIGLIVNRYQAAPTTLARRGPHSFLSDRRRATPYLLLPTTDRRRADKFFYDGSARLWKIVAPLPIDQQTVVRDNRDTLYSPGVFAFDPGPVTITLP